MNTENFNPDVYCDADKCIHSLKNSCLMKKIKITKNGKCDQMEFINLNVRT